MGVTFPQAYTSHYVVWQYVVFGWQEFSLRSDVLQLHECGHAMGCQPSPLV